MRATIYRWMGYPWVYRLTCGTLFVIGMATFKLFIHWMKVSYGRWGVVTLAAIVVPLGIFIAYLVERPPNRHGP